jgi:hypothetical protein
MNGFWRKALVVLGVLVLAALLVGLGYRLYWMLAGPTAFGRMPMLEGPWQMHRQPYLMDRLGRWPSAFLFGGVHLVGWALGIGVLVLAAIGVASLFRRRKPAGAALQCAECGAELQAGWVACPHCGKKVRAEAKRRNPA